MQRFLNFMRTIETNYFKMEPTTNYFDYLITISLFGTNFQLTILIILERN